MWVDILEGKVHLNDVDGLVDHELKHYPERHFDADLSYPSRRLPDEGPAPRCSTWPWIPWIPTTPPRRAGSIAGDVLAAQEAGGVRLLR